MADTPEPSSSASSSSSHRRAIPEDTVVYAIYPDSPSTSLAALCSDLLSSLPPFLQDYIWQHDPFRLNPSPSSPLCPLCLSPSPPHLHGRTRFGDNLDDEWLVVSLLLRLSLSFPSISARVWDSDGDFLLIEAAFSLPRWVSPQTSPHRVFLRTGELHLLSPRALPLSEAPPPLADALLALRSPQVPTRAPDAVQAAIRRRIAGFPERAATLAHRARVRVPLPVARVLREEPRLISLAVEGFYDRDVDSMKHAARMERFLGGEAEIVTARVRMSRAMYGQLVQQRFQAPRCYPMPARDEGAVAFAEAELGMKIACGLEMMYQERRKAGEDGKGGAWAAFRRSLERSGYFGDLLEGSREYKRLLREAEESYRSSTIFSQNSDALNAPVRCIDEILASPYSESDFKGIDVLPSDDDSWMYSGEEELNAALAERQEEMDLYESKHGRPSQKHKIDNHSDVALDDTSIGEMARTLHSFVEKVSSFEGVEVHEDRELKEVDFDVDRFMECFKLSGKPHSDQEGSSDIDHEECSSLSDFEFEDYEDSEDGDQLDKDGVQDTFMNCYSDVLKGELKETTLEKSFVRTQQEILPGLKEASTSAEESYEDLPMVDIDGNLVISLLDSYKSQQGLPGPASNLLGSLGLKLSTCKNERKNE